jgi:hypothetical protein
MSFTLKLTIPDEFRKHWNNDRFKDSMTRIKIDAQVDGVLSGKYEVELVDMLKNSLEKAEVIDG